MTLLKITAIILMCVGAAACGRKGPLEAPPQATAPAPAQEVSPQAPDNSSTVDVPPQTTTP